MSGSIRSSSTTSGLNASNSRKRGRAVLGLAHVVAVALERARAARAAVALRRRRRGCAARSCATPRAGSAAGSVMMKRVPAGELSTRTVPPESVDEALDDRQPEPAALHAAALLRRRGRSARTHAAGPAARCPGPRPPPISSTAAPARAARRWIGRPGVEYFAAFSMRFTSACAISDSSASTRRCPAAHRS